jgi:holliday junction DNA helicase RuvA
MIATLSGILFVKHPGQVVVDVGGVGYEVLISGRTYDRLPAGYRRRGVSPRPYQRPGGCHNSLRFCQGLEEKELFLLLNTVSGVGPKLALGILSGISVLELCEALGPGKHGQADGPVRGGKEDRRKDVRGAEG